MNGIATMTTLLRRELWESPIAFKWTPLILGGLCIVLVLMGLAMGAQVDYQLAFTYDIVRQFSEQSLAERRAIITPALYGIVALFNAILFIIIVFYLAGSLYDDRKDRSILFWKSLPVSDTSTVLSKLLTAMILAPLLFLIGILLTQIGILMIASVYALGAGINPFSAFWQPAGLPMMWLTLAASYLVQALWLAPVYAWLLFCSSWAPRLPILVAIGIPVLAGLGQNFYTMFTGFRFPDFNIWVLTFGRIGQGVLPVSFNFNTGGQDGQAEFQALDASGVPISLELSDLWARLVSINLWIGVGVAVVLLAGAIWFRRRATDN